MTNIRFDSDCHLRDRGVAFWACQGERPIQIRVSLKAMQAVCKTDPLPGAKIFFDENRTKFEKIARTKIQNGKIGSRMKDGCIHYWVNIFWEDLSSNEID